MKHYNRIIICVVFVWVIISVLSAIVIYYSFSSKKSKDYIIEINRLHNRYTEGYREIDLTEYKYVNRVDLMSVSTGIITTLADKAYHRSAEEEVHVKEALSGVYRLDSFYDGSDLPRNVQYLIKGLITNDTLTELLRYSYQTAAAPIHRVILAVELIIVFAFIATLLLLIYIRGHIIKPFHEISNLPYELSKGHLPDGIKETKNRFFGRFIWGLDLLRQNLEEHKKKELQLQKDKKLMILSLSHDIKTPLSTIKLYAKALYDNLYTTESRRQYTARHIEEKADQIENYVAEIMKASTMDLFEFEVKIGEFYLSKLITAVQSSYHDKFRLLKTQFTIQPYLDKLIIGDLDKLIDVFDNIMQNAIKYGDGKSVSLSFEEEEDYLLISITNSGEPLPATDFVHMFESFWRGANAHSKQGNGLGLYISRQLLKKMGGDVYAKAQENSMSLILVLKKS